MHAEQLSPTRAGAWVTVYGSLRSMGTLKTVNISAIRPVVDHNEITLHFLRVLELNMPSSMVFIVMQVILAIYGSRIRIAPSGASHIMFTNLIESEGIWRRVFGLVSFCDIWIRSAHRYSKGCLECLCEQSSATGRPPWVSCPKLGRYLLCSGCSVRLAATVPLRALPAPPLSRLTLCVSL